MPYLLTTCIGFLLKLNQWKIFAETLSGLITLYMCHPFSNCKSLGILIFPLTTLECLVLIENM